MAVDYYHHLIVRGPHRSLTGLADRIRLVETRRVAGVTTKSVVPFSLASLYVMANVKGDVPGDPYDMIGWRPVRRDARTSEVRYRFHTRNLEVHPLIRRLSRVVPRLTFALVTICLDDMDHAPFTIQAGRLRGKWLGGEWREPFWARAARERGIDLEEAYEDDELEVVVHSRMLDEAVRMATGTARRYRWTGGTVSRDLDDERGKFLLDLARALKKEAAAGS